MGLVNVFRIPNEIIILYIKCRPVITYFRYANVRARLFMRACVYPCVNINCTLGVNVNRQASNTSERVLNYRMAIANDLTTKNS